MRGRGLFRRISYFNFNLRAPCSNFHILSPKPCTVEKTFNFQLRTPCCNFHILSERPWSVESNSNLQLRTPHSDFHLRTPHSNYTISGPYAKWEGAVCSRAQKEKIWFFFIFFKMYQIWSNKCSKSSFAWEKIFEKPHCRAKLGEKKAKSQKINLFVWI